MLKKNPTQPLYKNKYTCRIEHLLQVALLDDDVGLQYVQGVRFIIVTKKG